VSGTRRQARKNPNSKSFVISRSVQKNHAPTPSKEGAAGFFTASGGVWGTRHRGIAGRTLSSSSPTRRLSLPRKTQADESQVEIVEEIGQLRDHIVTNVRRITEPLFMLFEFMKFDARVYEEIVRDFVNGRVT